MALMVSKCQNTENYKQIRKERYILSKSNTVKGKNLMYVQQMKHLPAKTINDLVSLIDNTLKPKKYAVILHDKDTDSDGNPKEPHVHVMMSFDNARSVKNVSKILGEVDENGNVHPEHIEIWKGDCNNGYAYLIHATDKARTQYQYDAKNVIANFDYPAFIQTVSKEVEKVSQYHDASTVKVLLDMLYAGTITKEEIEKKLTGSQYAKNQPGIEKIWAKRLEYMAEEWRKDMIANHKTVRVIWIYGESGTGKTSFAKKYAESAGQDYFVSGSSRDVFQRYAGQHTMILDELRPNTIPYQDFLRITDPFGASSVVMAPSRYSDKALACDLIIITTPYSPFEYYGELNDLSTSFVDSFEQLYRRITLTMVMSETEIMVAHYDEKQYKYVPDPTTSRPNPYSAKSRGTMVTNNKAVEVFNEIFD